MIAIALSNQKGGVGKTSLTHHLSGTFAALGRRVLAIDWDGQGSLTQGHAGPAAFRALDPRVTAWAIAAGEFPEPEALVRPSGFAGLDLVYSSRALAEHNRHDPRAEDLYAQLRLADFVARVEGRYDVVLIDCPPNLQVATWQAYAAATHLLIPLQPEDYGAQGVSPVLEFANDAAAEVNPSLRWLGIVANMVDRREKGHATYLAEMADAFGRQVLDARIDRLADYKSAVTRRRPISHDAPRSRAAAAMKALALEVEARVAARDAAQILPFAPYLAPTSEDPS